MALKGPQALKAALALAALACLFPAPSAYDFSLPPAAEPLAMRPAFLALSNAGPLDENSTLTMGAVAYLLFFRELSPYVSEADCANPDLLAQTLAEAMRSSNSCPINPCFPLAQRAGLYCGNAARAACQCAEESFFEIECLRRANSFIELRARQASECANPCVQAWEENKLEFARLCEHGDVAPDNPWGAQPKDFCSRESFTAKCMLQIRNLTLADVEREKTEAPSNCRREAELNAAYGRSACLEGDECRQNLQALCQSATKAVDECLAARNSPAALARAMAKAACADAMLNTQAMRAATENSSRPDGIGSRIELLVTRFENARKTFSGADVLSQARLLLLKQKVAGLLAPSRELDAAENSKDAAYKIRLLISGSEQERGEARKMLVIAENLSSTAAQVRLGGATHSGEESLATRIENAATEINCGAKRKLEAAGGFLPWLVGQLQSALLAGGTSCPA